MASGEGGDAVVGIEGGSWHAVGLTSPCLQEASTCTAILQSESMSLAGTGMKVARSVMLLVVGLLAFPSGATGQTCTTGSKAIAVFAGFSQHACVLLVSKSPPSG